MKLTLSLLALLIILNDSFAQEQSKIILGLGYPTMLKANRETCCSDFRVGPKNINIHIEKPLLFGSDNSKHFYFTPGIGYIQFEGYNSGGGLGGGSTTESTNKAFSAYLKLLYSLEPVKEKRPNIYMGFHTGFQFYTNTSGTISWWAQGTGNGVTELNENGKDFFNMIYFGFLIGYKPFAHNSSAFHPQIEIAF